MTWTKRARLSLRFDFDTLAPAIAGNTGPRHPALWSKLQSVDNSSMKTSVHLAILPIAGLYWDTERYGLDFFALVLSVILVTLGTSVLLFRRALTRWAVREHQRSEFVQLLRRFTLSLRFRPPEPGAYSGLVVVLQGCALLLAGLGLFIINLVR